jgi:NaMN:DMB phosphoribosyltransferase
MIACVAGIAVGAAKKVSVLLAGGTQMTPVLATITALNHKVVENVAIGTTRWITQDPTSDIGGIVSQIAPVPILAANLDFGSSKLAGLQAYEAGIVKEGVGAGGSVISAIAKSRGSMTMKQVVSEIEMNYEMLMKSR